MIILINYSLAQIENEKNTIDVFYEKSYDKEYSC